MLKFSVIIAQFLCESQLVLNAVHLFIAILLRLRWVALETSSLGVTMETAGRLQGCWESRAEFEVLSDVMLRM